MKELLKYMKDKSRGLNTFLIVLPKKFNLDGVQASGVL